MSRWGDEKTLLFIRYYRQHECLWNSSSPLYKNKTARENAYMSLLEQFNDDKLTVKMVRVKIKNLRTTYHQELNKIRDSKQSGAGSQVYKPSVCWFEEMDSFLSESLQNKPTTSAKNTTEGLKRKLLSPSDSDIQASGPTSTVNYSEYYQTAQPANIDQEPAGRKLTRLANNKKSHSEKLQHDEINLELSDNDNRLNNVSTITTTPRACEDEFHFFGMNVAAQLRTLPLHVALKLQTDFQNTLFIARIHGLNSSSGADDNIMSPQTNEQLSDSETVVHNVDEKVYPVSIQQTNKLPFHNQLSNIKME